MPEGNLLGMPLPAARKVSSARPPPWWSFLPGFGARPGARGGPAGTAGTWEERQGWELRQLRWNLGQED